MSEHIRIGYPKEFLLPTDVEGFESLAELALDLRWTWNHATDQVWRQLDPVLWELTHNPWVVLQTEEVPVGHVTNGVHTPTWDSAPADDLWTQACGKDRWLGTVDILEQDIRQVSDTRLWQFRINASKSLVEYAREHLSRQLAVSGAPPEAVEGAKHLFDPNTLTLGFARRFASYKRPNLLLHDPERLLRLLTHPQRPVQLIMAGKAHPADQEGQVTDSAMDAIHPPARGASPCNFSQ